MLQRGVCRVTGVRIRITLGSFTGVNLRLSCGFVGSNYLQSCTELLVMIMMLWYRNGAGNTIRRTVASLPNPSVLVTIRHVGSNALLQ